MRLAAVAAVGMCERDAIMRDDTRLAKPGLPPRTLENEKKTYC